MNPLDELACAMRDEGDIEWAIAIFTIDTSNLTAVNSVINKLERCCYGKCQDEAVKILAEKRKELEEKIASDRLEDVAWVAADSAFNEVFLTQRHRLHSFEMRLKEENAIIKVLEENGLSDSIDSFDKAMEKLKELHDEFDKEANELEKTNRSLSNPKRFI